MDEMAKTLLGGFCKDEQKAFDDAVKALSTPVGKDAETMKIFNDQNACRRKLDDVHNIALKAHPPKP